MKFRELKHGDIFFFSKFKDRGKYIKTRSETIDAMNLETYGVTHSTDNSGEMDVEKISPISLVIFEDAESWLRDNAKDLTCDSVCAVRPISVWNPDGEMTYKDIEENATKVVGLADHVNALRLLCEQVGRTLFVGGIKSPFDLLDACNWDVEVVDAYWQLVFRGEVIYG